MLPVSAANDQYTSGFLYWENGTVINWSSGDYNVDILSGYFPASFSSDDFLSGSAESGRLFQLDGSVLPHGSGRYDYTVTTDSQFYVEVLYSVPLPVSVLSVEKYDYIDPSVFCRFGISFPSSTGNSYSVKVDAADISQVIDGTLIPLTVSGSSFIIPDTGFDIERFWGYRFYFNPLSLSSSAGMDMIPRLFWQENNVSYTFSDPNYSEGIFNEVTVNTGILKEINGTLTDIKTSTIQIQQDISDIKDTVTDTSEQLQNPSSNIWQAAGSTISGAIESLFVPSEQDIAAVKDGFDQLAQDKLGGAYTAMETVDSTLEQVNDKLNNPSAAEGVEFPGISVPLGGEVGTVTLLEAQMVTMPVQLTTILHPIAGTIVSIVCGLGTFNVLKDMVECFLSGFSYSEFLHRNKGGSDE